MSKSTQHIDDFLKGLPKKENPFKTPDNYFDKLSDTVDDVIFTEKLPKETGYQIPNNYFEELSDELSINLLRDNLPKTTGLKSPDNYFDNFTVKKPQSKVISLLPYLSTAAAILIGFFIFNSNSSSALDELSTEEIISYLSTDREMNSNYLLDNTIINTNDALFASIDVTDIDIEDLDLEITEYDILDY